MAAADATNMYLAARATARILSLTLPRILWTPLSVLSNFADLAMRSISALGFGIEDFPFAFQTFKQRRSLFDTLHANELMTGQRVNAS